MDQVKGNNYRNLDDKKSHVISTLSNYLHLLKKQDNAILSDTELKHIITNCVFFSQLHKEKPSKMTNDGLVKLMDHSNTIISDSIRVEDVSFEYEALKLYYYLKESTVAFRNEWGEKTGYSEITTKTEHWSRIRALARRLGLLGQESYCELQPLADYATMVQVNINLFINQPQLIIPSQTKENVVDELKRMLKREIGEGFRELNHRRMWTDERVLLEWKKAYNEMGTGSRNRRARIIEGIFDEAAPHLADIPNMNEAQVIYLQDVINMVEKVLNRYGCVLHRFNI